jgi:poly(A) polymerase
LPSWFETAGVLKSLRLFLRERTPQAYIVGGYLRDQLLGRETRDIDLLVPVNALPLGRQLADHLGGSFVPLDEERGVARIVLQVEGERYLVDLSQMRGDLEADLARRDFTINALAADLFDPEGHLIDPYGGQRDLKERVVRAVSKGAFEEDPLRLLRGVRLAGELGFRVESRTERWMRRHAPLVITVSPERLRGELCKILSLEGSAASLRYLQRIGILTAALPELQETEHPLDTLESLESTLPVLKEWPPFPHLLSHLRQPTAGDRSRLMLLKLTTLLHHLGQAEKHPPSEALDTSPLRQVFRRLRFATFEVRLGQRISLGNPLAWRLTFKSPLDLYRFFRETKGAGVEALLLSLADRLATLKGDMSSPEWRGHLTSTRAILSHYFGEEREQIFPPTLLTGNDLQRRFHLEPGPLIGHLLEAVRQAQVEGKVRSREEALKLVEEILPPERTD